MSLSTTIGNQAGAGAAQGVGQTAPPTSSSVFRWLGALTVFGVVMIAAAESPNWGRVAKALVWTVDLAFVVLEFDNLDIGLSELINPASPGTSQQLEAPIAT